MVLQYIYNDSGKTVGVFIPINEWWQIAEVLKKTKDEKKISKKSSLSTNIKKGMKQVSQIESGKIKSISLQQLLDEL